MKGTLPSFESFIMTDPLKLFIWPILFAYITSHCCCSVKGHESRGSHESLLSKQSAHNFLPNIFHHRLRPKRSQQSHHNIACPNTITYSLNRLHSSFLKQANGDFGEAWRRFRETLEWRQKERIDDILHEKNEHFEVIKMYYPHYFHLRGWRNEPVYYEKPAKMNLAAMKRRGVTVDILLRHFALVTEYMWRCLDPTEDGRSIYVIDLDGMRLRDFVGDVITFVKRATEFTSKHYPERSGNIFVVNVPPWFSYIWKIVKPMVDPDTVTKIAIVGGGNEINAALKTCIPLENIPPDYGGKSMPLGYAPEERFLVEMISKNNVAW